MTMLNPTGTMAEELQGAIDNMMAILGVRVADEGQSMVFTLALEKGFEHHRGAKGQFYGRELTVAPIDA